MTWVETITMIKDVVVAGAAAFTATAAWLGLRRWREELGGKAEFEVARALAHATYALRDAIKSARSPWFSNAEFPVEHLIGNSSAEENAKAWDQAYRQRMAPVLSALSQFEGKALEAEALWGQDSRMVTDALLACVNTLWIGMESVVNDKAEGGQNFKSDRNFGLEMRAIVSARSDGTDKLSTEIKAAVTSIEQQLRPHLRK